MWQNPGKNQWKVKSMQRKLEDKQEKGSYYDCERWNKWKQTHEKETGGQGSRTYLRKERK